MSLPRDDAKQLLERLIFQDSSTQEWVQDVWDLSPTLGESAARFAEVFEALVEYASDEQLDNLLQTVYQPQLEE